MKYIFAVLLTFSAIQPVKADLWGGDLPLLAQIVTNTLNTLMELRKQSQLLEDEMEGINDRINRVQTIIDVVQPSTWEKWKDPREAINRLRIIYHTLPKEYRSVKSDAVEDEIAKAMNLVARVSRDTESTFKSGKELERRGADASPGVATKLTASGVGTLVAMEAQSQVIQSHITSLLAQMLAEANEKESRLVVSNGTRFAEVSSNLGKQQGWFSQYVMPLRMDR